MSSNPGEGRHSLPLFPLNTVLFPGGPLSLRIFEPRYVDMVGRCMREGSPFGVVMISSGAEVGEAPEIADIGTSARIVDFSQLPDGLLGLSCLGEHKVRILSRQVQPDGLSVAEVEYLPDEAHQDVPAEHQTLEEALRSILPRLDEVYARVTPRYDDASWLSFRLAEIVPLELPERLELLTLEDPLERLRRIAAALPQH